MDKRIPVMLHEVWHSVIRRPEQMFVFIDKKALITYYTPWRTVVYLHGDFSGDGDEVNAELHRAALSALN